MFVAALVCVCHLNWKVFVCSRPLEADQLRFGQQHLVKATKKQMGATDHRGCRHQVYAGGAEEDWLWFYQLFEPLLLNRGLLDAEPLRTGALLRRRER